MSHVQDKDESVDSLKRGLPVVSISIGDAADFLFGTTPDELQGRTVRIDSGDALVFGGNFLVYLLGRLLEYYLAQDLKNGKVKIIIFVGCDDKNFHPLTGLATPTLVFGHYAFRSVANDIPCCSLYTSGNCTIGTATDDWAQTGSAEPHDSSSLNTMYAHYFKIIRSISAYM